MNPKANTILRLVFTFLLGANGLVAIVWPSAYGTITRDVTIFCLFGGTALGLSNVFHLPSNVVAVLTTVFQALGASVPESAKQLAKQTGIKLTGSLLAVIVVVLVTGCISSAPIVPETPANKNQISSCQSTANWHNGLVVGDFVLGGLGGASGVLAAAVTDQGQKTALATGGAVAAGLLTTAAALTAYTAATFANGNCSSVVGPLPVTPFGVKKADAQ